MACRLDLPKKGELDYWLMGKSWQPTVVRADTLSALVGRDASNVSFIKLDVEGTEHKLCKDILESLPVRGCVSPSKQNNLTSGKRLNRSKKPASSFTT
jgi:hypothetical protein